MTDTKIKLPLRSVSQINQYTRCPMNYKLARIDKVWPRPAAWLPQGTAFHAVAEAVEVWLSYQMPLTLDEAKDMFRWHYARDINRLAAETPNFEWWFHSGPYGGERDIERRYEIGLEQIEKFFEFMSNKAQQIWIAPDGTPAVELSFDIELDGIRIRGFIDAVVVVNGELRVRDYKTGNKPGDDFQLGVYALAVSMLYGVPAPKTGDYYMAGKKGKKPVITEPYDLTEWTREKISERFQEVEAGIQAGEFPALPEPDKCGFCDVNLSCPVFN
ncbi:Cas4 exonuclease [Mycobacterium phage DarthPhader]|uniref:Cas4 exonuclease n=1 Tax=Mycobacterium phage DarthPhader TaxID=1912975 RepID=A0A1I9S417_9CAUD|nr:exonuclease [Mycobacterium phage DarthPhader]AOZ61311.1 Cas4 exonuclease [Mycobacterium phage DarthPhader]